MKLPRACLLFLALPLFSDSYLRIRDAPAGTRVLEIAERRFSVPDHPDMRVSLLGVAHIGSAPYYRLIQERLDKSDLVLFEGVGGDDPAFRNLDPDGPMGGGAQARMAQALGLEFQLFAIRYDRKHFKNSDLSPRELMELFTGDENGDLGIEGQRRMLELMATMEGSGVSGQLLLVLLGSLQARQGYAEAATWALVEILGNLPADFSQMPGLPPDIRELMTALIDRRNDRVLEDVGRILRRTRPPNDVVIFYGAAHMPDLEQRLIKRHGLVPEETLWLPAMRGNLNRSGLSAIEKRMFRNVVNQQLRALRQMMPPNGTEGAEEEAPTPPAPPEEQSAHTP